MKVSEITTDIMAPYLHLDEVSADDELQIEASKKAAVAFVCSYTGLTAVALDDYEDVTLAVQVLIQDLYDNRTLYVDKNNLNRLVESILGLHCENFLGSVPADD